eukprot:844976-Lingulodinium_polyedra.AAC.1
MRCLREPLTGTERAGWAQHRHGATAEVLRQHGAGFREAIARRDAGAALSAFNAAADQWLADR